tara:strand:- start:242 stop:508 length:267 start_codon:yes stop_codon:yes gene_type:complete
MARKLITTPALQALNFLAMAQDYPKHLGPERLNEIEPNDHTLTVTEKPSGIDGVLRCRIEMIDGGTVATIFLDVADAEVEQLPDAPVF